MMSSSTWTSLLYFLGFGLFFYWMMKKGGCGMHGHGGHGAHGGPDHGYGSSAPDEVASGATKDPVCGMLVEPNQAAGLRTVSGQTFSFCSVTCLAKFDADPEGFARPAAAGPAPLTHAHHEHNVH